MTLPKTRNGTNGNGIGKERKGKKWGLNTETEFSNTERLKSGYGPAT